MLPVTVVAAHLRTCAVELAAAAEDGSPWGTAEDFAAVVGDLLAGQRAVARALDALADRVRAGQDAGALAEVSPVELQVTTEVLQAAATAVVCSADALEESVPSIERMVESIPENTHL
ncbi:MAG: hypothetical protein JWQ81_8240 [Amycolatopsis sp.]|uniref:hypothetical protein n=1 Tax=Amycolatopsis sp. TaxID=37632 RepID=UPI00260E462F|nr:hypothetical protein [Amycolatopsis sp.]MCU1687501.1 hypothetical protein [Amycolatopsis sp.]